MPGVLLVQTFKRITCFGRAFHVNGVLAVMADGGLGACWTFQVVIYRGSGFAYATGA